jgi:hypothetical protein
MSGVFSQQIRRIHSGGYSKSRIVGFGGHLRALLMRRIETLMSGTTGVSAAHNNAMQTDKVKLSRLLLAQKPRQLAFAADRER